MEASAGLVAGSHNRNELVLIRGHEEVYIVAVCSLCYFQSLSSSLFVVVVIVNHIVFPMNVAETDKGIEWASV